MAPLCDRLGFERFRSEAGSRLVGTVLEIGAGSGSNFAFYSPLAEQAIGVEPESYLAECASALASDAERAISVVRGKAELLPLADSSVDMVLSFLVLCSVQDIDGALREIRRVLKPGGTFVFVEHVRSTSSGFGRLQDFVGPIWKLLGGGCRCNRDTRGAIQAAGFVEQEVKEYFLRPGGLVTPVSPLVTGVACNPN